MRTSTRISQASGSGSGEAADKRPSSGPPESAPGARSFPGHLCAFCPASLAPGDGHLACFRCLGADHAAAAMAAPVSCVACRELPEEGILSRHLFFSPAVELADASLDDVFGDSASGFSRSRVTTATAIQHEGPRRMTDLFREIMGEAAAIKGIPMPAPPLAPVSDDMQGEFSEVLAHQQSVRENRSRFGAILTGSSRQQAGRKQGLGRSQRSRGPPPTPAPVQQQLQQPPYTGRAEAPRTGKFRTLAPTFSFPIKEKSKDRSAERQYMVRRRVRSLWLQGPGTLRDPAASTALEAEVARLLRGQHQAVEGPLGPGCRRGSVRPSCRRSPAAGEVRLQERPRGARLKERSACRRDPAGPGCRRGPVGGEAPRGPAAGEWQQSGRPDVQRWSE
ncbi:unnamed protein product [Boreogadus saida]